MRQTIYGVVLYLIMMIPPILAKLESVMIFHMLVQFPLLILAGWLVGKSVTKRYKSFFFKWNENGIPGLLIVLIVTTYWMLPRTMDEALSISSIQLFKFISLPLAGLAFRDSWHKLQTIGKSFIYLNYISMFGLMGWLYIDSPIQLCNNYLEVEQKVLGWGFLIITGSMLLYIVQAVFIDHSNEVH